MGAIPALISISNAVCLSAQSIQKLSRTTLPLSTLTSARAPGEEGIVIFALSPGAYFSLSLVTASRVAASVTEETSPRQSEDDTQTT